MAYAKTYLTLLLALMLLTLLVIANDDQQQTNGSLPSSESSGEPNTKEQIAEAMAMIDQSLEKHRLNNAKGFYQQDRKRLEDLLDTQRTEWNMSTLAEEAAHTNTSATPAFWAHVLAEKEFVDFGFVIFRLDYSNETRWNAWYKAFDDLVEASMNATTRRKDVKSELVWEIANDRQLEGYKMQDLPLVFQTGMEVPPGQNLHIALMVDEAVMASLLDPQPGVTPWIMAVNVYYDFENPLPRDDNYPGFFKVAVESVIPDLWPLMVMDVPPPEVWSWGLNFDNEIFEGFRLNERFRLEKWLGFSYFGLDEEGNELYPKEHDEL